MQFKLIATYDNYMLANMTMGLLTGNNIKAQLKDEHIVTVDPLLNPAVGGIKLLVEVGDYERALDLIKEAEEAHLKDIACPYCGNHSIEVEEKTSKPTDFWGKLKNQVLFGQTSTYSKNYRCKTCKKLIDELPASF
jgi:DNA-directed RNA polymerase subunit RPC12/RpoP